MKHESFGRPGWHAMLVRLRPENRDYQRQAWVLGLEAAGLIGTTRGMVDGVETHFLNDVLADALEAQLRPRRRRRGG